MSNQDLSSQSLKNLLKGIEEITNKDIIKEIKENIKVNQNQNIYSILTNIEDPNKVLYIFIIAGSIYFFSKLNISINIIFGLIIGVLLVYYQYNKNKVSTDNFNEDMMFRIQAINTITKKNNNYLYIDTDLVELISNIIDFRVKSIKDFDDFVHQINQFLKIKYQTELGVKQYGDNIDVAKILANNALNKLTTFFHNIEDDPVSIEKLEGSIKILKEILYNHIDVMIRDCNKKQLENGITHNTKFIEENRFPCPSDVNIEVMSNRYRNFSL